MFSMNYADDLHSLCEGRTKTIIAFFNTDFRRLLEYYVDQEDQSKDEETPIKILDDLYRSFLSSPCSFLSEKKSAHPSSY
jgi:hypothetical protein